MSIALKAVNAQSEMIAGLLTSDRTLKPHNKSKKKTCENVPNTASA